LGPDTEAKSIEITWPSGIHQILKDVKGDRVVKVDEPPPSTAAASKPK
jgi:hypothetical protein